MFENFVRKIAAWFIPVRFYKRLSSDFRGIQSTTVNDPPETVIAGRLYLIGDPGQWWLAILRCPCGCGADIQLPMSMGADPCWRVSGSNDKPSLWPSINRTTGCRSHFFLRRGKIEWCFDVRPAIGQLR